MTKHTVRYTSPKFEAMQYTFPASPEMIEFLGGAFEREIRDNEGDAFLELDSDFCSVHECLKGLLNLSTTSDSGDYIIQGDLGFFVVSAKFYATHFESIPEKKDGDYYIVSPTDGGAV